MDCELMLDGSGDLVNLFQRDPATGQPSKTLLTPEQVAGCVKFVWLEQATDSDGLPSVRRSPYRGPINGLKVNVIAGPTGSGKTSLIYICAGGMETPPKFASDTKCPTVYLFKFLDGNIYALMDTAGICDTAAEANADVGLQELLINAIAATIKKYNLEIVSFLMCVDTTGRLPGNFAAVWPQMKLSLGADALDEFSRFIMTKANMDSVANRGKVAKLADQEPWKKLQVSPLGWPVTSAGRENLTGVQEVMQPVTTDVAGIGGDFVDPRADSLATKQKLANDLQRKIAHLQKGNDLQLSMTEMHAVIHSAYEELLSIGSCSGRDKQELKRRIDDARANLTKLQKQFQDGQLDKTSLRDELALWREKFDDNMDEIRKMHGLGAFFKNLVGGVTDAIDEGACALKAAVLKVTESGKISLTELGAGGMETQPKLASDTKCPTV